MTHIQDIEKNIKIEFGRIELPYPGDNMIDVMIALRGVLYHWYSAKCRYITNLSREFLDKQAIDIDLNHINLLSGNSFDNDISNLIRCSKQQSIVNLINQHLNEQDKPYECVIVPSNTPLQVAVYVTCLQIDHLNIFNNYKGFQVNTPLDIPNPLKDKYSNCIYCGNSIKSHNTKDVTKHFCHSKECETTDIKNTQKHYNTGCCYGFWHKNLAEPFLSTLNTFQLNLKKKAEDKLPENVKTKKRKTLNDLATDFYDLLNKMLEHNLNSIESIQDYLPLVSKQLI